MFLVKLEDTGPDFPGGPVFKNLPANAGDVGWIPGLGRSHMRRTRQLSPFTKLLSPHAWSPCSTREAAAVRSPCSARKIAPTAGN